MVFPRSNWKICSSVYLSPSKVADSIRIFVLFSSIGGHYRRLTSYLISATVSKYDDCEKDSEQVAKFARLCFRRWVQKRGCGLICSSPFCPAAPGGKWSLTELEKGWTYQFPLFHITWTSCVTKDSMRVRRESTFLRYTANYEALQEFLQISVRGMLHAEQSGIGPKRVQFLPCR